MQISVQLVLVALGSLGLVIAREERLVVGSLLVQWLGLVWTMAEAAGGAAIMLGLSAPAGIELATAIACSAVLAVASWRAQSVRPEELPGLDEFQRAALRRARERARSRRQPGTGWLEGPWSWGLALAAGLVALPLAGLVAVDGPQAPLALVWTALSALVALTAWGGRSPAKLSCGLVALLNSAALLLVILGPAAPGPLVLDLISLGRLAMAALLAYAQALLVTIFHTGDLDALFGNEARNDDVTVSVSASPSAGPPERFVGP